MPTAVESAYHESSQYLRWTLHEEELKHRRQIVHDTTVKEIRLNIEEELRLTPEAKFKTDFPSTEEANLIVEYYAAKVLDTGALFKLPSHLKATAAAYVRRFYLAESPLRYHPKTVMITSLFLATKTCEHHIDLEHFVSKLPKSSMASVLELEFLISSAIKFDFVFWSAYRPLYGFILDMESVLMHGPDQVPQQRHTLADIGKAHEIAKALINSTISSDLPFQHSPAQLALASLLNANEALVEDYLRKKGRPDQIESLRQLASDLQNEAKASFDDSDFMAQVIAIDKKLYYSKDPALKKDTALYKRNMDEAEKTEGIKRRKKGDAIRDAQEAFGSVLS